MEVGGRYYVLRVMKSDYDEHSQIRAAEGTIVMHSHLTYGYGEKVTWAEVQMVVEELTHWALRACKRHDCAYEIHIAANYW